ncbi:MAG: hypothetical protein QM751_01350 [Paludibacteraceae bacterium]
MAWETKCLYTLFVKNYGLVVIKLLCLYSTGSILKNTDTKAYELEKLFQIQPYSGRCSKFYVFLIRIYSQLLRFFPTRMRANAFLLIGVRVVMMDEKFIYYPEVFQSRCSQELYRGTWQSPRYFEHAVEILRKQFVFNTTLLNSVTRAYTHQMADYNSVSIHILSRRLSE